MKKKLKTALPIAGIIIGIAILAVPFISDRINRARNSRAISSMTSKYDHYEKYGDEIEKQLHQAELYNKDLAGEDIEEEILPYDEQLSFDGAGVMAWIEIPDADIKMVIYHGTSDEVLADGAGHLMKTSLPVGGASTHAVITAHSGMQKMNAFNNLRILKEGDVFYITTLGRKLAYKTESIETVLPEETQSLEIVKGEDRVTLVTCTPYGINDHRLLVHGVRIKEETEK